MLLGNRATGLVEGMQTNMTTLKTSLVAFHKTKPTLSINIQKFPFYTFT
jgi:hypothetical protein